MERPRRSLCGPGCNNFPHPDRKKQVRINSFIVCFILLGLPGTPLIAAEREPLAQGLHRWPALGGKLLLVVGTYQDTVHYRRTYNFFFKLPTDDAWNQVSVLRKQRPDSTWESATGGDLTLADGTVLNRKDGIYFVVAEKQLHGSYYDKGTMFATWYKLTESGDEQPDGPAYQFKPVFTRKYPNTAQTVEEILAKEATLDPGK
jgi:hypothetical protein